MFGLENLEIVEGGIGFYMNDALLNFNGFDKLKYIGEDLWVEWHINLTSFQGFENLKTIGGVMTIKQTQFVSDFIGFSNLTSAGEIRIWWNDGITSLQGLDSLSTIESSLNIWNNQVLTSLSGINNLSLIGGNLSIEDNSALTTCEVQSICNYLAAPNGTITISNNSPGCNNQEEVLDACVTVGIKEILVEEDYIISPNPFTDYLSIEFSLDKPSRVVAFLFNNMGQAVAVPVEKEHQSGIIRLVWDSSALPPGLYFMHMQAGEKIVTRKIIRQ